MGVIIIDSVTPFTIKGDTKEINEQLDNIRKDAWLSGKLKKDPSHYDYTPIYWELQDAHFMIEYPKKQYHEVLKYFQKIRILQKSMANLRKLEQVYHISLQDKLSQAESTKNKMLHNYFDCLIDHVNDHKDAGMELGHGVNVVPLKVSFRDDIQTLVGIATNNKNITGEGFTYWTHAAVGTGVTPPTIWSDSLAAEIAASLTGLGFVSASGIAILYGFPFGESLADNVFQEALVRNQATSSGSKVLCKQTHTNDPIDHKVTNAGFGIAGVLEYAPIVDPTVIQ